MSDQTQERIARNDATFRDANERIAAAAEEIALEGTAPFLCECADTRCTELVRLELDYYAEIRSNPRRFFVMPGHEDDAVVLIERGPLVDIVEKTGRAGEVAERLAGKNEG